jgi:hypothetical protein
LPLNSKGQKDEQDTKSGNCCSWTHTKDPPEVSIVPLACRRALYSCTVPGAGPNRPAIDGQMKKGPPVDGGPFGIPIVGFGGDRE